MLSFAPIESLNKEYYRDILKRKEFFTQSCEYAYANLFSWSGMYGTTFAEDDYGFYISMRHEGADYYLCPIAGTDNIQDAFISLFNHVRLSCASEVNFVCLPENYAKLLQTSFEKVTLDSDRGNFDYIYYTESLSSFSGKALHAKKNHLNKFLSLYANNYEYRSMTSMDVPLCLEFNKKWYGINEEYVDYEFSNEHIATTKLLKNFDKLGLVGGVLFAQGSLCAYTLASDNYDGSDTLIVHTEKGLYDVPGAYPAICSLFLKDKTEKYKYVNREDDLNDEGLRRSKMSYNPCLFEQKFSACVKF